MLCHFYVHWELCEAFSVVSESSGEGKEDDLHLVDFARLLATISPLPAMLA